ncbi:MAG: asparagine synthase (glutamine-hydrolyzing) [Thiohalomonadales bacterium]
MCGITLIYHNDKTSVDSATLTRMTRTLDHRGPDGTGTFIDDFIGLGHTRLSIVDIADGAQPMRSHDGRYMITFNGEIYNFKDLRKNLSHDGVIFDNHSDTEVILALYQKFGEKCVEQLRGMFAFAILDTETKSVFIARDRLGIKPLFYHWDGTTLYAASEIKAIFASKKVTPKFNQQTIRNHFTYQFSVTPFTLFEGILELEPGHSMTISPAGEPEIRQYWDLHFPEEVYDLEQAALQEHVEDSTWIERFDQGMHDATICHTMGDVPIGTYLSGGIDSSATSALLKEHYNQVPQSYSIHFTNPASDESHAYKAVAQHLDLPNHELTVDDNRDQGFLSTFELCLYHLEQPQRMAVDIPHFLLSDFVRKQDCKVVYTGDGADEILGGYDCFRQDAIRCWGNEQNDEGTRAHVYLNEYTKWFSESHMQHLLKLHAPEKQDEVYEQTGTYPAWYDFWELLREPADKLFSPSFKQDTDHDSQMPALFERMKPHIENRHPLNQSLYIETKTRLPGWILWKSDRLSMAHGVEARTPFMDHPLAELTAKIPCGLKLKEMDEKHILKRVFQQQLPEIEGDYKKRAFYTPIREWFFSEQHLPAVRKYLSAEALQETGYFEADQVERMITELISAPTDPDANSAYAIMINEWLLMLVLSIQILHRQFIMQTAPCFEK